MNSSTPTNSLLVALQETHGLLVAMTDPYFNRFANGLRIQAVLANNDKALRVALRDERLQARTLDALKDVSATLSALSAKHKDGMDNLVGTSLYNARRVVADAEQANAQ